MPRALSALLLVVMASLAHDAGAATAPRSIGLIVDASPTTHRVAFMRFADALAAFGARISFDDHAIVAQPPADGRLRAIEADMNHIPDAAMTLAVVALFAEGTTRLTNIGSWRVKETDRIAAMATELRKLGATVDEGPDWIAVTPVAKLSANAAIDTYDDHRMAMCFSLVALSDTPVTILDPKCTAKTFPDYFEQLARISTLA